MLYEDDTDGTFRIKYTEFNDDFIYAGTKTEELKDPKLVDYNVSFDTDKINVALTFDQELLAIGNPQLKLSVGNQEVIAHHKGVVLAVIQEFSKLHYQNKSMV